VIDWLQVEETIRDSITGRGDLLHVVDVCARAYREDPARYKELHRRIKAEEQAKVRIF